MLESLVGQLLDRRLPVLVESHENLVCVIRSIIQQWMAFAEEHKHRLFLRAVQSSQLTVQDLHRSRLKNVKEIALQVVEPRLQSITFRTIAESYEFKKL